MPSSSRSQDADSPPTSTRNLQCQAVTLASLHEQGPQARPRRAGADRPLGGNRSRRDPVREPISLSNLTAPTGGPWRSPARARVILERLFDWKPPRNLFAKLLSGDLGQVWRQLRLAGLQSGHLAGIRQGLIYSAGATLRSSAGLCPRISTRIAERNGKNATASNPAVNPPVASFRYPIR
jgi:hypothetical protein